MFCKRYADDDANNTHKRRNIKNSDKYSYNCGGYAIGCFSWYQPDACCGFSHNATTFDKSVQDILRDFPSLRLIESIDELMNNEYAIAFRMSSSDFHFIKRNRKGIWFQKTGSNPWIRPILKSEVFSDVWCAHRGDGGYKGKIAFFAQVVS